MDQHLTSQSSTVFRSCHSLIYIFDVESEQLLTSDVHYFIKCLAALKAQNAEPGPDGGPTVYVLLHKMDLISDAEQKARFGEFEGNVRKRTAELGWKGGLHFFGTSIWNETLYKVSEQRLSGGSCHSSLRGSFLVSSDHGECARWRRPGREGDPVYGQGLTG